MQNPIEVRKHTYSLTPRKGVKNEMLNYQNLTILFFRKSYAEKQYSVFRGSQMMVQSFYIKMPLTLGYTHIEGYK